MHPTPAGDMLVHWWGELAHKYPTVTVDTFVVMPNHIHALLVFQQTGTVALPDVMRELESGVPIADNFSARGRKKAEEKLPNLLTDIRPFKAPGCTVA